jgi:hypothetical protein
MRRLMAAVSAIGLLGAQPVLAAQRCPLPTDQTTFDVQALRSELMVLATGCHTNDQYNAFIHRYQADLQANERAVSSYFSRHYGRSAQTEHDRFVTELANALSREGSQMGGDFCAHNGLIFNEVLALNSPSELPDFAAGKDLLPVSVEICEPAATSGGSSKSSPKATHKKHS